ncbi:hypothetical protein D9M69_731840 [compost metagenome]
MLRLHEKFDLADTATTKLHIMATNGDVAMPLMGMNLSLDGMNVGDCSIVKIFTPNIWSELN